MNERKKEIIVAGIAVVFAFTVFGVSVFNAIVRPVQYTVVINEVFESFTANGNTWVLTVGQGKYKFDAEYLFHEGKSYRLEFHEVQPGRVYHITSFTELPFIIGG